MKTQTNRVVFNGISISKLIEESWLAGTGADTDHARTAREIFCREAHQHYFADERSWEGEIKWGGQGNSWTGTDEAARSAFARGYAAVEKWVNETLLAGEAAAVVRITIDPPTAHEPRYAITVNECTDGVWSDHLDAAEHQPTLEMAENAAENMRNDVGNQGLVVQIINNCK